MSSFLFKKLKFKVMANMIILRKRDSTDSHGEISVNNKIVFYKDFEPFELPDNFLTREEELDLKDYLTHLKDSKNN